MAKNMIAKANDIIEKIDILIPVPLHKKRLIERKYNQSLLLCREITKRTNKKTIANFLFKIKHTKAQVKLNEKDRVSNLKKTFFVNEKYLKEIENYKNLNFAIIDDVVTTGTTINECTKALNNAGIKNVYSMTFAKTIKKF
jgi:ComF family protein